MYSTCSLQAGENKILVFCKAQPSFVRALGSLVVSISLRFAVSILFVFSIGSQVIDPQEKRSHRVALYLNRKIINMNSTIKLTCAIVVKISGLVVTLTTELQVNLTPSIIIV